jgi:hypothetical protein
MHFNVSPAGLPKRLIAWAVAVWTMACAPTFAQSQLVACDLVNKSLASTLLQTAVTQPNPGREIRPYKDGATESACLFFAPGNQLRVHLMEYPKPADAARAIREHVSELDTGSGTYVKEKGLGDEAYLWSAGPHIHGFSARKGRRFLLLIAHTKDAVTSEEAKARFKAINIQLMVSKL